MIKVLNSLIVKPKGGHYFLSVIMIGTGILAILSLPVLPLFTASLVTSCNISVR